MDKKRKIQLIAIIVLMIILIGFLIYTLGKSIYDFIDRNQKSAEVVEKFNEIYEKEGTKIVLFASPTCKWCKKFVPVLNEIAEEYDFTYTYLDVSLVFQDKLEEMYKRLDLDYNGIPHLVILNNQKVIGDQVGAEEKEKTIELLKNAGIIKGDVEDGKSISTSS